MYVCLCKALTESDVSLAARACLEKGVTNLEDVIEVLGLNCEEACRYCVKHPEVISAIVADEFDSQSVEQHSARLV